jgi:PIN domain nuclease of toxin-antitoxin system
MNVLVDTCIALWVLEDSPKLTSRTRIILAEADCCYLSALSLAEIEIKRSLNKLEVADDYRIALSESGFSQLPYEDKDSRLLDSLPFHHKDPFDRMIICQAMARDLPIVTADRSFTSYPVSVFLN